MHAGGEHLLKHPRVRTHGGFVYSIDGYVDDDSRSQMSAFRRTTGHQSLHVLREAFDVVRRMLHVIADVVRIGLSVLLALLETTIRAGMRAGVINRLSLCCLLYTSPSPRDS